jgi:hypothetical protein
MAGTSSPLLSNAQATAILNIVRQQLRIALTSATHVQAGAVTTAALIPSSPVIDASELANGVLNLAWAAKDVLFNDPNPVAVPDPSTINNTDDLDGDELLKTLGGIFGKQPYPPPALGGSILSQTAGMAAQLFGTISPPQLKVQIRLAWKLTKRDGTVLQEGQDFIASQGLSSPTVSLVVVPPHRELRIDSLRNPGGEVVCLSVDVSLQLGTTFLPTFTLGPLPILLLPLLIPTIVVLFSEPNFDLGHESAALIVVPKHSPFSSAAPVFKTLRSIESAVSALRSVGGLVGFFLGLDELLGSVPDQPRFRFVAADQINRLGNIVIKEKPWYAIFSSDRTFDDAVQSLMVFGLPGTTVHFFNDVNCQITAQGGYDVTLGPLDFFACIRDLDTNNDHAPVAFPDGSISHFDADSTGDDSWTTDMSSVQFDQNLIDTALQEQMNPPRTPPLRCVRIIPPKGVNDSPIAPEQTQ